MVILQQKWCFTYFFWMRSSFSLVNSYFDCKDVGGKTEGDTMPVFSEKLTKIYYYFVSSTILRRNKDGDWYIYPQFLAHENFNNVHKKVQKVYKILKPTIHNVLSTGTNIVKNWLSLCLIRCVRFARYFGKMYSRHLFSYGGLALTST